MRRKLFALFLALAMVAAACGSDDPVTDPGTETTAAPTTMEGTDDGTTDTTEAMTDDAIQIEFWHAMADDLGAVVDELVDRYNSSQDAVQVNATFQGSYDDTYNALLAAFETDTAPNIVQNFDLAAQTMFDTGRLVPAHTLMSPGDADSYLAAPRDYYSDETGMVALAFNSSTPIVYYNAEMFEAAGLDAPAPDWNFSDFQATCDALEANGVEFCVTFGTVGWFFEQILANSGGLYFNNDNGRTARATEVEFNKGQGAEVFEFLTGLIADGHAPNLGNTWSDTDSVFFAGQAAMNFDSTSGARGMQDGADFEVKTAFIPHSDSSERNGVVIGGAALWLIDSEDDAKDEAAWDFMKFMTEADQQVTWHTGTGYFPVLASLQESPPAELSTFWDENPNFVTAIEQLATTNTTNADDTINYAVLGGRAGPFPEIRRIIVEAYDAVLNGGLSAQEALDEAAAKANQALADYNAFFE
ncbi:MAG: ABC transporter substrate-binding protein [Acidimicrobiia bacterium]|nr:ABC transporter substrate-binding protein [Acidimicrobiia bacterium]NNL27463.1 ABC transporter substrate-binding protein [Acidimicrobiia bacterium]